MVDNVYSLLGQATTDEYRRRREEERKYYKDLKKEQMKAALLQPLIAGAVGIGKDLASDITSKLFLPGAGKNFTAIEGNRSFINNFVRKEKAVADLTTLQKELSADDRVDTMIIEAAKLDAQKRGYGTEGQTYQDILRNFQGKRTEFELANAKQLKQVTNKLTELSSNYRGIDQIAASIKEFDSMSPIRKVGRRLIKGLGKDEYLEEVRREIFTGERTDATIYDAEYEKFKSKDYADNLLTSISQIQGIDNDFVLSLVDTLEKENPAFYGLLDSTQKARVAFQQTHFNVKSDSSLIDTIIGKFHNSIEGMDAVRKGNSQAWKDHVDKVFTSVVGTADDFFNSIQSSTEGRLTIENLRVLLEETDDKFYKTGQKTFAGKNPQQEFNTKIKNLYDNVYSQIKSSMASILSTPEQLDTIGRLNPEDFDSLINQYANKVISTSFEGLDKDRFDSTDVLFDSISIKQSDLRSFKDDFFQFVTQNLETVEGTRGYTAPDQERWSILSSELDISTRNIMANDELSNQGKLDAIQELLLNWTDRVFQGPRSLKASKFKDFVEDKADEILDISYQALGIEKPLPSVAPETGGLGSYNPYAGTKAPEGLPEFVTKPRPSWMKSKLTSLNVKNNVAQPVGLGSNPFAGTKPPQLFADIDFNAVSDSIQKTGSAYLDKIPALVSELKQSVDIELPNASIKNIFGMSFEEALQNAEAIETATINLKKKVINTFERQVDRANSTMNDVSQNILSRGEREIVAKVADSWSSLVSNFDLALNSVGKVVEETKEKISDINIPSLLSKAQAYVPDPASLLSNPTQANPRLVNPNVEGLPELVNSAITDNNSTVDPNIILGVIDVETEGFPTIETKRVADSGHDAHGIMQIKTSTAVQPGFKLDNIFDIADKYNIPYDEELMRDALQQMEENFKAGTLEKVKGKAGAEVIRLLQVPEINVTLGTSLIDFFSQRYDQDLEKVFLAYQQGYTVADNFKGNRDNISARAENYLEKFERRGYL